MPLRELLNEPNIISISTEFYNVPPTEHHQPLPVKTRLPKIVWVIPIAAIVITVVSVARMTQGPLWWKSSSTGMVAQAAPMIILRDQNSEIVRTSRYQGRQRMVVVFYDGVRGPENSRQLLALRESYPQLQAAKTEVIAISVATPYRNRQGIERVGPFPFPLLCDVDYAVHGVWGIDGPVDAVFLVDRRGIIRWMDTSPDELVESETILRELEQIP